MLANRGRPPLRASFIASMVTAFGHGVPLPTIRFPEPVEELADAGGAPFNTSPARYDSSHGE